MIGELLAIYLGKLGRFSIRPAVEEVVSADWEWLPTKLLDLILDKLIHTSVYIKFGAVCKRWQFAAEQHKLDWRKKLPMLLQIPSSSIKSKTNAAFFRIPEEGGMLRQLSCLPYYNRNRVQLCSTHGWLAYGANSVLTLLNPFTGDTIRLPPIIEPTSPAQGGHLCIDKVALSADPCLNPNAYEVLVKYYYPKSGLAHFSSADATWTQIDATSAYSVIGAAVLYHQGQFVVLTEYDVSIPSIYIRTITTAMTYGEYDLNSRMRYIVESSMGDLLLVTVHGIEPDVESVQVHKLVHDAKRGRRTRPKWVVIKSIGKDVLFLGGDEPICVSPLQFPQCRPNCIYFTYGVYHLKSRTMERHRGMNKRKGQRRTLLWI